MQASQGQLPGFRQSDFLQGLAVLSVAIALLLSLGAKAATLIVDNSSDSGAGSLRAAIAGSVSGDVITFTNALAGQSILLTSGQLTITTNLTIDASSLAGGIAISGGNSSRVFEVASNAAVNFNTLTIRDGYAPAGSSYINCGGGILNRGTLTLTNCTITANRAVQGSLAAGGGIESLTSITLNNCLVWSNLTTTRGGGVDAGNGVTTLKQCTVTANSSSQSGGGVSLSFGNLIISQCTVASNSAGSSGGGLYQASGNLRLTNTIVAGNVAPSGANIVGQSGQHNLTSGNPLLAALGNYGGPTLTMPLRPGSPALDGCTGGTIFTADQRGLPRIVGPFADIGAVEGVFYPAMALTDLTQLGDGSFRFSFTNLTGPTYSILATTNVVEPINTWSNLGFATESPSGVFQFTDTEATNYPQRFYRFRVP